VESGIVDSIRSRFVERCRNDLQKLDEFRHGSAELAGATTNDMLIRTVHGLAGAGGTFGFPEVSRKAGELETLMIDRSSTEPERRRALDSLIATLESLTSK
jgi:HPt (histidine-containing phosphotransfer) domain-containing protein